MLVVDLKNLLKHLSNKKSFAHAQIAFGSRVTADCVLRSGVCIDEGCYVSASTLGDNVHIMRSCRIFESELESNTVINPDSTLSLVRIGSYSYFGEQAAAARMSVGRFTSIGPQFLCGTGTHPTTFASTSPVFYSTAKQCGMSFTDREHFAEKAVETSIGHDVWIGARVFVRDGVRIGHGAIIAAGAVVAHDVPDYAITGGVPARVIRFRFDDEVIRQLLELQWWNWSEDRLRKLQPHFAQDDIAAFLKAVTGDK